MMNIYWTMIQLRAAASDFPVGSRKFISGILILLLHRGRVMLVNVLF